MNVFFSAKKLSVSIPRMETNIHTLFSDGLFPPEKITEKAWQLGIQTIAFSEHTESWHHRDDPDWIFRYIEKINFLKKRWMGKIDIYAGVETPAVNFSGNIELGGSHVRELDFVLGTVHRYPGLNGERVRDLDPNEMMRL